MFEKKHDRFYCTSNDFGLSVFQWEKANMTICYNRLWKLLIDKGMKKKDLQRVSGISSASVTKLAKNENVNTEILQKICIALKCDICDIMEMMDEKSLQP